MKAKAFIYIFLCLVMVASTTSISAAASNGIVDASQSVSEDSVEQNDFIEYASIFFNGNGRFRAIDRTGADVSEDLLEAGVHLFSTQKWNQLNNIFTNLDVQYLIEREAPTLSTQNIESNNSNRTYTVEDLKLFITEPEIVYSKQEFSTKMAATYTVASNNQIVDAYSLYLIPAEISGGVAPIYLRNVVLYAPDISGTRVTFSGSFSAYKDTVYCGHFTHEFTADSNGNIVD